MLALQTMPASRDVDSPVSNVGHASVLIRSPQQFDAISTQILSLTSIATNLQREMTQLSRRSKDNATDLISLKEATNTRDEDIRKSLRELVTNLSSGFLGPGSTHGGISPARQIASTPDSSANAFLLDDKPHVTSTHSKSVLLPRIPSPNTFAASMDREMAGSPAPYHVDAAASLALLEKILREMSTKDGQDRLTSSLTALAEKLNQGGSDTTQRLEEILVLLRDRSNNLALVAHRGGGNGEASVGPTPSADGPPKMELDFGSPRSDPRTPTSKAVAKRGNRAGLATGSPGGERQKPYSVPGASEIVGDDIQKLLRRLKDSVTENGGMTAEVKALVRELRGEVLGMGRELGRKLSEAGNSRQKCGDGAQTLGRDDVARIVSDGLAELKEHMERTMKEKRRQSNASTMSRNTVDSQEVYEAVRHAMNDLQLHQHAGALERRANVDKDEIVEAVRESWQSYKPEIELQNFGLEREEVLQCLRQGLDEYRPMHGSASTSRDEVLDAIREGLEQFQPPAPVPLPSESSITREEVLLAVRESLESFDFATAGSTGNRHSDITREDVLDAVREGLQTFDFNTHAPSVSRDVDLTGQDVLDVVRSGLDTAPKSGSSLGDQLLETLHEVIEGMRIEFKAVSDEAKQNVAANGRDTEQVLDALKDGLEHLRSDVELYVDRAADVTGKDEIIDSLRSGFDNMRAEMERFMVGGVNAPGGAELSDSMRGEFEHLRQTIASTLVRGGGSADKDEILDAMRQGFEDLRAGVGRNHDRPESIMSGTGEILDALNEGVDTLRSDVAKMVEKPVDMTASYEILDTLKQGLAGVRAEINGLNLRKDTERTLGPDGGQMVVAESLKRNDIENLEVLITQLRIKVEALDAMSRETPQASSASSSAEGALTREDLTAVEEMLRTVQAEVAEMAGREHVRAEDSVKKEDIDAIETLLINTKAKIDDMVLPNAESAAKHEHVEAVEFLVRESKEAVEDLSARIDADGVKKEDMSMMESLLKEVVVGLEGLKEQVAAESLDAERVTRTDLDAVEQLCSDTKIHLEQMDLPNPATLPTRADIAGLEELVTAFREKVYMDSEVNIQAIQERKLETESLAEKLGEVKGFLAGLREDMKSKLDDGGHGMEVLGKMLEGLGETVGANATVTADVKEVMETVTREFERSHGLGEGLKLEQEQKTAEMLQKLDVRFDEIMTKYDDAQLAAETKARAADERHMRKDELLAESKAVADDLKLLIDTLGTTITDSADRMADDSKTVFNRVEETHTRLEEAHLEAKDQHRQTQEEVQKALDSIGGLRGEVAEHHPKLLTTIKDVLLIVSQHYEHAQQQAKEKEKEEKARIEATAAAAQPAQPMIDDVPNKFDDGEIHVKLDKLINHANAAGKSFAQIDLLDQIHMQVVTTATEVSEFVAAQAKLITEDHEEKEKQAGEAAIALEKRLAQKDRVESDVAGLNEERMQLQEAVLDLKEEKEQLGNQKMKLAADVASLEMALKLRQEELVSMEARAEGLERRILDGVIDHSRAFLISRPSTDAGTMSLKRVASNASTSRSTVRSSGMGMALKPRLPPIRMNPAGANPSGRRILSLNQITGNVAAGMPSQALSLATDNGLGNLKRSHSVRTGSSIGIGSDKLRKSSWGGRSSIKDRQFDKENEMYTEGESGDEGSDAGTERRTSFSTEHRTSFGTVSGTLGTESTIEEAEEEERGQEEEEAGRAEENARAKGRVVVYDGSADSGVGDEIATADLTGENVIWAK